MTRLPTFSSPFLLGFDQIEQMLNTLSQSGNDGYPPYDIEHINEQNIRISLALAGFKKQDLTITLEGRQLIIRGKQKAEDGKEYLHRGIATRQFIKKFVLADGMDIKNAALENGLLNIDLVHPEPENIIRTIEIS